MLKQIFILIPWFHPAYKAGGPIRSIAGMLKQFEDEDVQFRIFCGNKDLDGTLLDAVAHNEWVEYNGNTKVWYSTDNKIVPVLKEEMSKTKLELLYIIGIYDWKYNFEPLLHFSNIKKVISVRGMLHPGALSQKKLKKKLYLKALKLLGWHKKNLFHVTDEAEKEHVLRIVGKDTKVAVAGNFPSLNTHSKLPHKNSGELKMVSVGLMSAMKNLLLVLKVLEVGSWKLVVGSRESGVESQESAVGSRQLGVGSIEYNIYGPVKDKDYWEQCKELIKKMPSNIRVQYHGEIAPDEVASVLSQHQLFILPSKSENYGHAIIEALSAGVPVITSESTPWNGLKEAGAGINIDPEDIEQLRSAIGFFLDMDENELSSWSVNANRYAMEKVDVESIKQQYKEMFGTR